MHVYNLSPKCIILFLVTAPALLHAQQRTSTPLVEAQPQRASGPAQQLSATIARRTSSALQPPAQESDLRDFCSAHPGEDWHEQDRADETATPARHCPTDGERAVAIVNEFMVRHKDLVPCYENSVAITAYLEAHTLNPLDGNSFEQAYQELKKKGQLKIHSK